MTHATTLDAFGVLTEPATLKLERLLPGPIDRVWAYLTDSDLRKTWLAAGDMNIDSGAPFELTWRNDELSAAPSQRPDGFGEEHRMTSCITVCDPPHKLSFTWQGTGDVSFDLTEKGDDVLLTITHSRIPERGAMLMVGAGWHMHLDILTARTNGRPAPAFWPGWQRLRDEYDRRLPA
jgi:uncharacterized protein YndB with AHSA1/START domain